MALWDYSVWQWIILFQHELLLFAGVFFLIGAIDDFAVDLTWFWMRLTGKVRTHQVDRAALEGQELEGGAAIFIPAWDEAEVIGDTIAHMLQAWPQDNLTLYIGCYRNDPATIAAVTQAAPGDPRLRLVIHDRAGPTTKADCLNRLYQALESDEERSGQQVRMVVFHDAEDMVDPAALPLLDRAMAHADFVQLPVLPMPQRDSRWLGSHYCEEFAEAHGKAMPLRAALTASVPSAGVGCAAGRAALDRLARSHGDKLPFAADSLTEDYELGISITDQGGRGQFVRVRGEDGELVATRAYFPARIDHIVRQKTRWVHGIALQGWDRLGWSIQPSEIWMRMRDRRGPMTALVLLMAYLLLALSTLGWGASMLGYGEHLRLSTSLQLLLAVNAFSLAWRGSMRFAFAAREYGIAEGARAVLRLPVANIIAIMAGRRALSAYCRSLLGHGVVWDKTPHYTHPARDHVQEQAA